MFDAFARFANGIIGHETSNHGGGGGRNAMYAVLQAAQEEEEKAPELRLAGDSLRLSTSRAPQVSLLGSKKPSEVDLKH